MSAPQMPGLQLGISPPSKKAFFGSTESQILAENPINAENANSTGAVTAVPTLNLSGNHPIGVGSNSQNVSVSGSHIDLQNLNKSQESLLNLSGNGLNRATPINLVGGGGVRPSSNVNCITPTPNRPSPMTCPSANSGIPINPTNPANPINSSPILINNVNNIRNINNINNLSSTPSVVNNINNITNINNINNFTGGPHTGGPSNHHFQTIDGTMRIGQKLSSTPIPMNQIPNPLGSHSGIESVTNRFQQKYKIVEYDRVYYVELNDCREICKCGGLPTGTKYLVPLSKLRQSSGSMEQQIQNNNNNENQNLMGESPVNAQRVDSSKSYGTSGPEISAESGNVLMSDNSGIVQRNSSSMQTTNTDQMCSSGHSVNPNIINSNNQNNVAKSNQITMETSPEQNHQNALKTAIQKQQQTHNALIAQAKMQQQALQQAQQIQLDYAARAVQSQAVKMQIQAQQQATQQAQQQLKIQQAHQNAQLQQSFNNLRGVQNNQGLGNTIGNFAGIDQNQGRLFNLAQPVAGYAMNNFVNPQLSGNFLVPNLNHNGHGLDMINGSQNRGPVYPPLNNNHNNNNNNLLNNNGLNSSKSALTQSPSKNSMKIIKNSQNISAINALISQNSADVNVSSGVNSANGIGSGSTNKSTPGQNSQNSLNASIKRALTKKYALDSNPILNKQTGVSNGCGADNLTASNWPSSSYQSGNLSSLASNFSSNFTLHHNHPSRPSTQSNRKPEICFSSLSDSALPQNSNYNLNSENLFQGGNGFRHHQSAFIPASTVSKAALSKLGKANNAEARNELLVNYLDKNDVCNKYDQSHSKSETSSHVSKLLMHNLGISSTPTVSTKDRADAMSWITSNNTEQMATGNSSTAANRAFSNEKENSHSQLLNTILSNNHYNQRVNKYNRYRLFSRCNSVDDTRIIRYLDSDFDQLHSKHRNIFAKFHAFMNERKWPISFVAIQFSYSATRMGEILKFRNIKNGKSKVTEWSCLAHKMEQIMSDDMALREFAIKFQNFQECKQREKAQRQHQKKVLKEFERKLGLHSSISQVTTIKYSMKNDHFLN